MFVGLLIRPIVVTILLYLPSLGMVELHPTGEDTALLVLWSSALVPPAYWSSPALAIP